MNEQSSRLLAEIKAAQVELRKAPTFSQSSIATSGLTYYDLEAGAKLLYPVLTPLRNEIPRVSGRGGIQANWRAITQINPTAVRVGVSAGNRGAVMAVVTKDYSASYRGLGIETSVDFEAEYAGENFDDLRALAAKRGLEGLMLGEEATILGGNSSLALGLTPTPVLVANAAGGTGVGPAALTGTISVIAVALTFDGAVNGSVQGGISANISRTNADGSVDTFGGGAAQQSAAASIAVAANGSITATVSAVVGAMGYAWFWGAQGQETLGAITSSSTTTITALPNGTQKATALPAADSSTNGMVFDGLLTIALRPDSGSYVKHLPMQNGAQQTLTGDGAGGIVEIDDALKWFWDNLRLSPQQIWVSSQEARAISQKILANGSSGAQRFVFATEQDNMGGGVMIRTYLNRFSMAGGTELKVRIHPNMPQGTILFDTVTLPYPLSNVGNVRQVRTRQEYYQFEWPRRSRRYEYGVYADEVLQHYFPPALGVITNIGA